MMKFLKKSEKGVAGLNVLMSIVTMLFMIGIIVMVFVIAGNKLSDNISDKGSGVIVNETLTLINGTTTSTSVAGFTCVSDLTNVLVTNATSDGYLVPSTNYTVGRGTITIVAAEDQYESPGMNTNISASYTYCAEGTAALTVYTSTQAITGVTEWFSTFVVLAALVVMILMVVIIINSIKGSGLQGDNTA